MVLGAVAFIKIVGTVISFTDVAVIGTLLVETNDMDAKPARLLINGDVIASLLFVVGTMAVKLDVMFQRFASLKLQTCA